MINHYAACNADVAAGVSRGVVVIFDEVQKAMPGTLEIFLPWLRERGFVGSSGSSGGGEEKREGRGEGEGEGEGEKEEGEGEGSASSSSSSQTYSTADSIFVFVSDIGQERMIKLLLRYGNRSSIPLPVLRSEVKAALDDQWADRKMQFGKLVDEVVSMSCVCFAAHRVRCIINTPLIYASCSASASANVPIFLVLLIGSVYAYGASAC